MSQNLRSHEERRLYDSYDQEAIFEPSATHANDPPWDNNVVSKPHKPNATHFQSIHWDERVAAQHFKPNAKFINMFNRPTNSMPKNESELVSECRRLLVDGTPKDPLEHVRLICLSRGAAGIYNLGRALRRLAHHGDKVSLEAFVKGLHDIEMGSVLEATRIFNAFQTDSTGYINMKEFLFDIRFLSQMREGIINRCFQTVDKNNDDIITIADLRQSYSVEDHPLYKNGDEDKEEIMKRFLATFEEGGNLSAEITREDFLNYYAGISAMIEDDGYFDLLLREEYNL
ncbi:calcyphosin-like protein [Bradysia coprophila]|uniref:calcyphosin-like protein n=1 Tax=Bradysia coprophila TaxID=38358 RepID=UPI00187DCA36|nr:calcyphosin-like protein [Bradysia coprophila]